MEGSFMKNIFFKNHRKKRTFNETLPRCEFPTSAQLESTQI